MPASPWSAAVRANVALAPGVQKDAFGRLRTSQPVELFSKALEYNDQPLFYENTLTGGASATYDGNIAGVELVLPGGGSATAIRTSREYVRYRAGKSQQVFVTGNFRGPEAGCVKRVGYFDDRNLVAERTGDGFFFEVDPSGIWAVLRSSTSGSSVDTRIAQADWNIDPLDGTGPSGQVIDAASLQNEQVMVFDFGWLGPLGVRWGFILGGQIVIVHEIFPSNVFTVPFMSVASLPVRWEITSPTSAGSMVATCASVQSEGVFNTLGVIHSATRGISAATTASTTLRPLISIRLRSGFLRGKFRPSDFTVFADGAEDFEVQVLVGTSLTGLPAWNPASSNSTVEYDISAAGVSGGFLLHGDYGTPGGGPIKAVGTQAFQDSDIPITSDYAGNRTVLTLAVRPFGSSATNFRAALNWREFY